MEDLRKAGLVAPSSAAEEKKVEPYPDLAWAWNGFWRLSVARDSGFDRPLRLKCSEIEAYARLQGFSPEKARDFLFYCDVMDERWMHHVDEQRQDEADKRRSKTQDKTPAKPRSKPPAQR